jgi:ABC-type lipoprotein release transport system permease subunit
MNLPPLPIARIALRNVRRNIRRSLLTVFAIAFGLFCLIVFQALKDGLHREMVTSTVRLDAASLQMHAAGYEVNLTALKPLRDPREVERALAAAGVADFGRRLKAPALVLAGQRSSSVLLAGVEPEAEPRITFIAERIVSGSYLDEAPGVVLGEVLAESLGVAVGDEVTLMVQGIFGRPVTGRFPVRGLYRTDLASFDRSQIFMPLAAVQTFLQAEEVVTEIAARTPLGAEVETAERLRRELPPELYQVRTWQQLAPDVVQLIELNDSTMHLLILIVFAIVALGITNTMSMAVFERFRELGVLTAIGMRPSRIVAMIVLESFFLGIVGSLTGSAIGVAVCVWLGRHGIDLTRLTSANQYFATSHVLRAYLLPANLLSALAVTLATALLAGLYPAWKAARLQPADAIRHI